MRTAVVVMSKVPQPGFTKTRLNSVLTGQESADFHQACLEDICGAIRRSSLPGYIYYARPDEAAPDGAVLNQTAAPESASLIGADRWGLSAGNRAYFKKRPQRGMDLGERLYHAAQEILTAYEAVLLLGSDLPVITPELIWEARANLLHSEATIGPARDGGYYLLGIRQASPYMFQNIPWGTAQVFDITLQRIRTHQTRYSLLPPQTDIDTWADLISFYNSGQADDNSFIRHLTSYEMAAALVAKYGSIQERSRKSG